MVLALLGPTACGSKPDRPAPPTRTSPDAPTRAAAVRAIETLESAVGEARSRVSAADASGVAGTTAGRQAVSETRRVIVVANVALQKAREALVRGDDAGAAQAVSGVAERVLATAAAIPVTGPSPASSRGR